MSQGTCQGPTAAETPNLEPSPNHLPSLSLLLTPHPLPTTSAQDILDIPQLWETTQATSSFQTPILECSQHVDLSSGNSQTRPIPGYINQPGEKAPSVLAAGQTPPESPGSCSCIFDSCFRYLTPGPGPGSCVHAGIMSVPLCPNRTDWQPHSPMYITLIVTA